MKSTEPLNVDLEPSIRFSVSWPSVFACISLRTYNKQETRGQMATGPKCLHKCLGRTANRSFSVFQTHFFFCLRLVLQRFAPSALQTGAGNGSQIEHHASILKMLALLTDQAASKTKLIEISPEQHKHVGRHSGGRHAKPPARQ